MTFFARPEPHSGSGRRPWQPLATYTLISICTLVYIATLAVPGLFSQLALNVAWARIEPWRIVTSAFAHSMNITHIAFNMLALFSLGLVLEPAMGRARFLATYLISAIAGSVAFMWTSNDQAAVVGASGAVFGLFGCLLLLQRKASGTISTPLLVMLGVNFALGFIFPHEIAWQAHVGGFIAGIACAWLIIWDAERTRRRKASLVWPLLVAFAVLVCALAAARLTLSW